MTATTHEIECPICNGEGWIETMIPARAGDVEPRSRVTPCDRCDGHGEINVDADTRRLLEAAGGNVEAELAATKRTLEVARDGIATRSMRIAELEERLAKPCSACVGFERTLEALEAKTLRIVKLEADVEELSRKLTKARAELAAMTAKATPAPKPKTARDELPATIHFAGTNLRRTGGEWIGERAGCRIHLADLRGVRDALAYEVAAFDTKTGESVTLEAPSLDLLEAKLAVSLFLNHPRIAAKLLEAVEVRVEGSRAHG